MTGHAAAAGVAYSAIANGGHSAGPTWSIASRTPDGEGASEAPGHCNADAPVHAGRARRTSATRLATVVSSAARPPRAFAGFPLSEVPVAGKTGTAAARPPEFQDTSWFAAMVARGDDPDYVVVTMVEQGGLRGERRRRRSPATSSSASRASTAIDSTGCCVAARSDGLMDLVAGRAFADERRPTRHVDRVLLVTAAGLVDRRTPLLLYSATNQTLRQDGLDPFELREEAGGRRARSGRRCSLLVIARVRLPVLQGLRRASSTRPTLLSSPCSSSPASASRHRRVHRPASSAPASRSRRRSS